MSILKGKKAEDMACNHLLEKGLKLVEKNYNTKLGEIDLIMEDEEEIVFVEVKARKSINFGQASEFVDISKQKKIIRTTKLFLQGNPRFNNHMTRFDVFEINFTESKKPELNWIKDAFQIKGFSAI